MDDKYRRLLTLLYEKSYRYSDVPEFSLVSGKKSQFYFNCKPTTLSPEGLCLIGNIFFDRISDADVDAICGLTMGADPIAYATALISFQRSKPVKAFSIRQTPKKHGMKLWVEGDVDEGDRVVVVDDVITTGLSTIKAIERSRESNLEVVKVVALIDREEGGRENILKENVPVEAVFTKSDFLRLAES